MTINKKSKNHSVIYQTNKGARELKADVTKDTLWLTQQQITALFNVQKAAISKHLKNIFVPNELKENSVVSILETTALESLLPLGSKIDHQGVLELIGLLIRRSYLLPLEAWKLTSMGKLFKNHLNIQFREMLS